MKKYKKAALSSAFLFPGAGHLLCKKYISGGIISGISAVALYILISSAITHAVAVSNKIAQGEIPPDVNMILAEISRGVSDTDANTLDMATIVLVVMWVVSIIDSYRITRS